MLGFTGKLVSPLCIPRHDIICHNVTPWDVFHLHTCFSRAAFLYAETDWECGVQLHLCRNIQPPPLPTAVIETSCLALSLSARLGTPRGRDWTLTLCLAIWTVAYCHWWWW